MGAADVTAGFSPPFTVTMPARHSAPVVFSSPHSGRAYPAAFLAASRLDKMRPAVRPAITRRCVIFSLPLCE